MPIHPAREKQSDYPDVTSNIIIDQLDTAYGLEMTDAKTLAQYDNAVFAFMSPNDISSLEKDLENILKNK